MQHAWTTNKSSAVCVKGSHGVVLEIKYPRYAYTHTYAPHHNYDAQPFNQLNQFNPQVISWSFQSKIVANKITKTCCDNLELVDEQSRGRGEAIIQPFKTAQAAQIRLRSRRSCRAQSPPDTSYTTLLRGLHRTSSTAHTCHAEWR